MATNEAHQVHIETLYKQIDALSKDCHDQHKAGLDGLQRIHERIDTFTAFMVQLSEVNKDVQSLTTHQKTLEARQDLIAGRVAVLERVSDSNTEVTRWVKICAGVIILAVLGGVLSLVGLKG